MPKMKQSTFDKKSDDQKRKLLEGKKIATESQKYDDHTYYRATQIRSR